MSPENREFNREFCKILGENADSSRFYVNSPSNFNALQVNSLRLEEQGIFLTRTGNSFVKTGNCISLFDRPQTRAPRQATS
jgi:hypothetical protein